MSQSTFYVIFNCVFVLRVKLNHNNTVSQQIKAVVVKCIFRQNWYIYVRQLSDEGVDFSQAWPVSGLVSSNCSALRKTL